jgi:glycosyltransferase involved in cell wall biosynthesis
MPKKIKVLCLSFWTPPLVRPQSILIGKMIPEWVRQGVEASIVTYERLGDWDVETQVFQIPQFKIGKVLNKILPFRLLLKYFYNRRVFSLIKKVVEENNIGMAFSFSNPQESNILGAKIKKKLNIPFVSHFSDPWYDNPYKNFSWLRAKIVLWQEKFVIKNSDKVIFTNDVAKDLVMKKYHALWSEKAEVIPHCYNLTDYPKVDKPSAEKFIISYIGAFYKQRNPELLFKALKKIINSDNNLKNKFKIKLIGAANDYAGYNTASIEKMANIYGLKNNIEIISPVSYEESLKYMKLSDCLVVIDADMADSPFLPSKVVDYAGSGNNIIGITPKNSPTAQFIKNLGYGSFDYNQINELTEYLRKLILREIKIEINKEFLDQYDVRNTTAKLIEIFQRVVAEI